MVNWSDEDCSKRGPMFRDNVFNRGEFSSRVANRDGRRGAKKPRYKQVRRGGLCYRKHAR
jgi:hypothetical protein